MTTGTIMPTIIAHFAPFNVLWQKSIDGSNKPVRACVQAEMARPTVLVEIQVTAAVE